MQRFDKGSVNKMKKIENWLNPLFIVAMAGCLLVPMTKDDFLGNAVALITLVVAAIYVILTIIFVGGRVSKWFELCHQGASKGNVIRLVYYVALVEVWSVLNHAAYALATALPGIRTHHVILYHSAQIAQGYIDDMTDLAQKVQDDISDAYARNNP